MKPVKSWHDDMVTIWVTPETRDLVNDLRDRKMKIKTADDVLRKYLPPKPKKTKGE